MGDDRDAIFGLGDAKSPEVECGRKPLPKNGIRRALNRTELFHREIVFNNRTMKRLKIRLNLLLFQLSEQKISLHTYTSIRKQISL